MTHQATRQNQALLRAVAKQSPLYDRTDENYRKRLPSENSWDIVASETGEPVEHCKRRWRQLRNDYTRFVNVDATRKRNGQRRVPYPLASELRFLDRHLNVPDDLTADDSPSESEKDSETRNPKQQTRKSEGKSAGKNKDKSSAPPELDTDISQSEGHLEKYNGKESGKEREKDPEVSVRDESYLEEHLDGELTGFDSDQEESNQNPKEPASPEKSVTGTESSNSPASHSEFFVKQNRDPQLLVIGKKKPKEKMNDYEEDSNSRDPRDRRNREGSDDSYSPGRRSRRVGRSSMSIKDVPISRPTPAQRVTRGLQRRKSMGMAVLQSAQSSTSPVKITPVPRTVMPVKQTQLSVKPVQSRDDIFPRQESSSPAGGRQFAEDPVRQQNQSTSAKRGRPMKARPLPQINRVLDAHPQPSVATSQLPPIARSVTAARPPLNPSPKSIVTSTAPTGVNTITKIGAPKTPENITVMSYTPSPSSSSSSAGTASPKAVTSTVVTSTASTNGAASVSGSAYSAPSHITVAKRCERSIQTACPDITSDDHFFDMIRPQMKEMNQRQKLMFRTKVFRAVIETFDDATDFPLAGEQQHFNINTPSGYEQITDPELRLMRELVSLVSAAKVTIKSPAEAAAKPSQTASPGLQRLQQPQTQAKLVQQQPRQVMQRVFKPGQPGAVGLAASQGGPGQEKKYFRFIHINGKPNTLVSASLEDLQAKESAESSAGVKVAQPQAMNPRGGTVVPSLRPAASPLNTLFGQPLAVPPPQPVQQAQPKNQLNAPMRRYSVCGSGNPMMPNSAMLSANSAMESLAIKRRQASPGRGVVLQAQRPRYSASGAVVGTSGQLVTPPQAGNVQMRHSLGAVQANQKQVSSPSGVLAPQKTPQITHVQGNAFNDFIQPRAAPSVTSNSSRENSSPPSAPQKRSLVVANAKNAQKQTSGQAGRKYSNEIAATIAADDFSLHTVKREPGEIVDDTDDILGM
ncbi:hypothetical protein KR018_006492 [Drosophila ironensis]|nr:hypothetical protein KR018_006492 [Drosophila ironensis]